MLVGHSLGGMTSKAALARMVDAQGQLRGFEHLRFVALGVPWGGFSAADLAHMLPPESTGEAPSAFSRGAPIPG